MSNTQDLYSTTTIVGPELARNMRDTMHFPRQRKISDANVRRLAREMACGRFTPGTQIYICTAPDGQSWIINGNHTLEAIALSREPQRLTLTYRSVATMDEAGMIYAVFDIHRARSWLDSLKATGQDEIKMAPKVLSAIGCIEQYFDQAHVGGLEMPSRPDRLNRLPEYEEAAELFCAARDGAKGDAPKLICRAAIMAVALETLRYQPSAAAEFWRQVASDDGLKSGMPARALLRWMRNTATTSGRRSRAEHARAAALAWNAFFQGRSIEYVKPNQMAAFFLLGTPWDKGIEGARNQYWPAKGASSNGAYAEAMA